ncbi:MAG: hypothetical protein BroJett038_35320 [Chloroflexota bacterium]|nr:MAG: hypothetical protein BroJett038_35320 [Chloroflexota bacterium]
MDDLDLGKTIIGLVAGQKVFRRYTLKRMLGRGGMGVVWLARDEELGREVALKFLPETVAADRAAVADLKHETRRSLDLTHPNIVRIHDFVSDGRSAAISMEYVAGDSLSGLRTDQPQGHFEAAGLTQWVQQLCGALDYAHTKAKVVHRDLKPANLMVDDRGDLKVADFGIAASITDTVSRTSRQEGSSGTPVYMSPQQMMGEKAAATDDIYSLGATLYELLTGKPPFYSGRIEPQVLNKVPPSMAERRRELEVDGAVIPLEWEETIAACLAKEAADRPQSAGEVAERLGLGSSPKVERRTPNLQRPTGDESPGPTKLGPESDSRSETTNPRSRIPAMAGIAVGLVLLGFAGWYFGLHVPEQKRLAEIARLERAGQELEAARLRNEQERAAAEAVRGGIVVRTTPSGAEVRVGAVAMERSPLTLKDQKLGKYPVRIRLEGYEDWNGEVEVKENEFFDLDVALVRSTGTLALTSEPAGLEAEVVGRALPGAPPPAAKQTLRTPQEVKLPTGNYHVIFRRAGWPDQARTVEIGRNGTAVAAGDFSSGRLVITSTPSGAEVVSGEQVIGRTPLTLPEVIPGRQSAELRLKGHKAQTVGGEVVAGQELRLEAALEKAFYTEGEKATIPGLVLEMIPIASGTFPMGSASGGFDHERPVTQVRITKAYWLGETEVTQDQWEAVMGTKPSRFKGKNLPVEQVSWTDAMEFCRKLTERERLAGRLPEGYEYTLPTEAQWEYACRAGTTGDYAGSLDAMAWYGGNSDNQTKPVGGKQANGWGLYDMHGNVWEWCLDWYGNYPGGSVTDPNGASSGSGRVNRGGSWELPADLCRSALRNWFFPGTRWYGLGFRLALSSVR